MATVQHFRAHEKVLRRINKVLLYKCVWDKLQRLEVDRWREMGWFRFHMTSEGSLGRLFSIII